MKYSIEWSEVIKRGETNGRAWKMTKMNLKDEAGQLHDEVTTFDDVMTGGTLEGTIEMKGKYKNFKNLPKAPSNSIYKRPDITENVKVAQERKEASIEKAQDRSAWMWAKTNASTLLAGNAHFQQQNFGEDMIVAQVIGLATKIYHGEPTTPF